MTVLRENAESCRASAGELTPDVIGAIDFLQRWMDGAQPRSLLVSIVPDSHTAHGHTFALPGDEALARWIERCNRVAGLYWTVNACRSDLAKKATKSDVQWLLGVWGDLDPLKGCDLPTERERLLRLAEELMALPWPPTVIIDSGGGIQPLWRLETPLEAAAEFRQAIEALGRRIEAALGGIENTCNIDRVLRLPFTINHPNRPKVEQGRVPVMSDILGETGRRYSWAELETLAAHLEDEPPLNAIPVPFKRRNSLNGYGSIHLDGLPDYPTEDQVEALLQNHPSVRQIWDQSTPYPPDDASPSGWDQSFASTLAAIGLSPENIASYLRAYREHHAPEKGKQDRPDYILRTVQRAAPADASVGENHGPADDQSQCPPDDTAPDGPGRDDGHGAGPQPTAGDAQDTDRGTPKFGPAQPKAQDWPEPGELGKPDPAPEFPTRFLPTCLRRWVETQAQNMGCPLDFLAIPSLVTIAGCIGKNATLRPKRHDWEWTERPCLWGAVIAAKGTLKSPTLKLATAPLRAAEACYRERWKEDLAAWEARQEIGKNGKVKLRIDDPRPVEPKLIISDATIEATADAMVESRGLTLVRDELSAWFDNMARYSKGNDRGFYLECHAGGHGVVDRIIRGRQIVTDTYLNVIGGLQPAVAKAAFSVAAGNRDDGFCERFGLISYPEIPDWEGVRDQEPERDYKQLVTEACIRLAEKDWTRDDLLGGRPIVFDEDAQARFLDWYDGHMRTRVSGEAARERADHGFMSKGQGLVLRLAIVIHLFRWTCGEFNSPRALDPKSLTAAIGIFETYCVPMYARVLQAFGQVKAHAGAKRIAAMILKKRMTRVRFGDVTKCKWEGLREREDVLQALAALEDIDWVAHPGMSKSTPKGGRPTEAWLVNPRVHK